MTARLGVAAALALAVCAGLGWYVTHSALSRLDVESAALRGSGVPIAVAFTVSGYAEVLGVLSVAALAVALVMRESIGLPLAIVGSQLVSQGVVELVKHVFARARPDAWFYKHELGFSYPSGHAVTAVVFYGAWLIVLWNSGMPLRVRILGVVLLVVWMLGIGWSRVALGAHYPTDVLGGYAFGIAWLCGVLAVATALGAGPLAARAPL